MWIFGYGSLIWNPGFEYIDSKLGFIKGYVRRFWQGNDFHRGNPDKPGRVATLVKDEQGLTWGRAFLLSDSAAESSLAYLDTRESQLGGYCTTVVPFHPQSEQDTPFPALLYVAPPTSRLYMGPAPLPSVAGDIAEAVGSCGYNAEYLLRLAEFMRQQLPDVWDEHLYHLEHLVRARLKKRNLSVEEVMGERPLAVAATHETVLDGEERREGFGQLSSSPDFASRMPVRKLRCVDM